MAAKKKPSNDLPKVPRMPAMPSANGGPPPRRKAPQLPPAQQQPMMGELEGAEGPMGTGMMGPTTEERLSMWLGEKVLPKAVHGLYFQLRQKSIDGETVAHEWNADEVEGQDPDSLATLFYSQAVDDSQGSSGVTSYVLHAMRPSDGQSFSRCFFRLAQEDMSQGFDSEPGHLPEGHMAQAHRHAEVYARMMVGMTTNIVGHFQRQNSELAGHASKAIQLQVQVADMYQNMQDRSLMREITLKRINRKEAMKEKVLGYALQFLPDVLHRIGIVPGEASTALQTADEMAEVLATLDDQQVTMAMSMLRTPKHQETFRKAYYIAKQRQAKAMMEAAKRGGGVAAATQAQLNGVPPPAQMQPAQAAQAAQQQAVVQSPPEPPPVVVKVKDADMPKLTHGMQAFLGAMVDLDDEAFEAVAAKLSKKDRFTVTRMRAKLRESQQPG